MKIVYIITRGERGGAQSHVLELVRAGHDRGQVILATGEEGHLAQVARQSGAQVIILKNLVHPVQPGKDLAAVHETSKMLSAIRPDIVHCHSSKAGLIGRVAARIIGIPSVFTAHGWEFAPGLPVGRRVSVLPSEWIAARLCRRIIVVSQADYDLALRYRIANDSKLILIRNGIAKEGAPVRTHSGSHVEITMVARFASPKDHRTLLAALFRTSGAWRLNLVGDGPDLQSVKQLAMGLKIADRINFLGAREDVPEILGRSHIFVLISKKEGFPITILEAMRSGLPIVATSVGGIPEQIVDGETGFLVPTESANALTARLNELIASSTLRSRMGLASQSRFQECFTASRMIESTWSVYRSMVAKSGQHQLAGQTSAYACGR